MENLKKNLLENFICVSKLPFRQMTYEFSKGEMAVMYYLYTLDKGLSVGELAKMIGIGSGRMGDVLKALVEKEFIYREKDTEDKRRIIVYLSDAGKAAAKQHIDDGMAYMGELIDKIGADDAETMNAIMSKIVESYAEEEE